MNSIPWTGKLEALSEFDINDPTMRVLRDDMASTLDKAAGLRFKLSQRKYVCLTTASGTLESRAAGNTMASANIAKVNPTVYHIKEVVDYLRRKNIPPYDGEDYVGIFSVNALRGVYDSDEFQEAAKYGEVGSPYENRVNCWKALTLKSRVISSQPWQGRRIAA